MGGGASATAGDLPPEIDENFARQYCGEAWTAEIALSFEELLRGRQTVPSAEFEAWQRNAERTDLSIRYKERTAGLRVDPSFQSEVTDGETAPTTPTAPPEQIPFQREFSDPVTALDAMMHVSPTEFLENKETQDLHKKFLSNGATEGELLRHMQEHTKLADMKNIKVKHDYDNEAPTCKPRGGTFEDGVIVKLNMQETGSRPAPPGTVIKYTTGKCRACGTFPISRGYLKVLVFILSSVRSFFPSWTPFNATHCPPTQMAATPRIPTRP